MPAANFNRPPRVPLRDLPPDPVEIPAPATPADGGEQGWLLTLLPALGIAVMALFYLLISANTSRGSLFALPLLVLAGITLFGTVIGQRGRRREQDRRRAENELRYIRVLDRKAAQLQAGYNAQLGILAHNYPTPAQIFDLALVRGQRLWERRPDDADFATLRLGTGRVRSRVPVKTPEAEIDSPLIDRARRLAEQYRFLPEAPVTLSLIEHAAVGIYGRRAEMLATTRAMIAHLVTLHAPTDFEVYLIAPQAHYEDWRWLEWLPHGETHLAFDFDNIRNLMGHLSQVIDERSERQTTPHLCVIVDDPQLVEGEPVYAAILAQGTQLGASALCLVNSFDHLPGDCTAVIHVAGEGHCHYHDTGGTEIPDITADTLPLHDVEHLARALAPVTLMDSVGHGRIPRRVEFLDMYGVDDVEDLHDIIQGNWRRDIVNGVLPHPVRIGRESLAVDTEIWLDEDHHGPHGVLAGTTGAGKSELLQTLIGSLALAHDPRLVNFMLIDFKGGSTFNMFADLPHTVGLVTNLDRVQVERALAALKAETDSRQAFLKQVNVRDIVQYHRLYARTDAQVRDPQYRPLPHLFIIVDEFAQLAKEMPDFMRELVRTAQVGRSLGLHLILGTQSPMDVITDEMNDNLQFRICLRVQNIEASRAMLRRPDAAYLPAGLPGRGYFQVGERGLFKQFQTAYAGNDYHTALDEDNDPLVLELLREDGAVIDLMPDDHHTTSNSYTVARAIADTVIAHAHLHNIPHAPPMLLPPLPAQMTLASLFAPVEIGGWDGQDWTSPGMDGDDEPVRPGSVMVGVVDDVHNRVQSPYWLHLNATQDGRRRDGHVLVYGGPGTGKTTFIRTLALSAALLHPPERLHLYFLSFTGNALDDLGDLPHAERVVHGMETERVRRLFGRLIQTLNSRQAGQIDANAPVIVVCIDQYEQFRDSYYEQHMPDFERLVNEGRAAGIYLVITATSVGGVPDRLRSLIQQRIAFQLGSHSDYVLAVGHVWAEENLPPGRGFVAGSPPLNCQIALPAFQHVTGLSTQQDAIHDLITTLRERATQSPPPLKELPVQIPLDLLPLPPEDAGLQTTLGRRDDDALSLFTLDWTESGPHFIVTGPPGTGKTNLLRTAVLAACQIMPPDALRVLLVDFGGRSLRSLRDLKHVVHYCTDHTDLETQIAHLAADLTAFADAPDTPRTVVIIDDYDVTVDALGTQHALLRHLRDLVRLHDHLHIWLASYLERISDPLLKQLLLRRSGFGMGVKDSLYNLNVRTRDLPPEPMPPGRAFFADHNTITVVQTALVENPALVVNRTNAQIWGDHDRAAWQHGTDTADHDSGDTPSVDIDTQGLIEDLLGGE